MCTVKPYHILDERFGLFAIRLPSLSQGNGLGLWHNFDIFTHVFCMGHFFYNFIKKYIHAEIIHHDDLDEGYKVELKLNSHTIILIIWESVSFKTRYCLSIYNAKS